PENGNSISPTPTAICFGMRCLLACWPQLWPDRGETDQRPLAVIARSRRQQSNLDGQSGSGRDCVAPLAITTVQEERQHARIRDGAAERSAPGPGRGAEDRSRRV